MLMVNIYRGRDGNGMGMGSKREKSWSKIGVGNSRQVVEVTYP